MRYRQNIETCHLFNANIQSAFVVVTQKKKKIQTASKTTV